MIRYFIIHYIGQYLFFFFLVPIAAKIYFSNFPINQKVGPIIIKSNSKFNTDNLPFLIAHFSDTHINSFNPNYGKNFEMCLNNSLLYQPDVYLHTGDTVDDFCSDTRPKYGYQCRNDFIEFDQIFRKYNKSFKISLGAAGNHDMFGIYSFDSPNFNFLNTCKNLYDTPMNNYEEFLVSNYKVKVDDNFFINFISLNPFSFPTTHPVFMYFAHTCQFFLDRLESVVEQIPENEKIIFYSHYPQSSFTSITNTIPSRKSTKGTRIKDLIERPNTIAFISGHNHPESQKIEHHGKKTIEGEMIVQNCEYIESIGFDVKKKNLFEIITIDNERLSFHTIDPKRPNKCLITYPVPLNQTASHSFFDDENSPLRILCFDDKPLKIEIHGDIEGETIKKVKKIKDNVYLYEFPLFQLIEKDKKTHKESDLIVHRLNFDGDWKGQIEFYSNGVVPQFKEEKNHQYSRIYVTRFYLPLIFFYLMFVTFPFTDPFLKKEEHFYFEFLKQDSMSSLKYWFLTITGFCLRLKIQRLQKNYRWILFLAVLWPIFLPLSLMETEGHYGFIWNYGYYIDHVFRFSEHGQDFAFYYYVLIVFPVVLASASLAVNMPAIGLGGLETCLLCVTSYFFVSYYVWYYKLSESAGPVCKYVSVYSLGMIVLFPMLIIGYVEAFIRNRNGRNAEWYSEGLTLIRSIPM